jgi:mono/diheme cytochrome c family protein
VLRFLLAAGLFALTLVLGYGAVYGVSEAKLRRVPQPPEFHHPIPTDTLSVAWGRHIARTRGCFGCHGQRLQGRVYTAEWDWVARAVAPNLAAYARRHNATTLNGAIRHGVGHDGRALWSMPSYNWVHLRDDEVAALIAYLRAAPTEPSELPAPRLGFSARWRLATGAERHMADWVAAVPPRRTALPAPQLTRGAHLAATTCSECHGMDLRGMTRRGIGPPDLAILAAYSYEDFRALMKTGAVRGGREAPPLMAMVARDRFAYFTDRELEDLYAFLATLIHEPRPVRTWWRPDP